MTRLLITGATGFIGEPAARAARGHFEVHAAARGLHTGGTGGSPARGQSDSWVARAARPPVGDTIEERARADVVVLEPQSPRADEPPVPPEKREPGNGCIAHGRTSRPCNPGEMHFHPCDLLDADHAVRLVETVRPTHLLHLAWIATPGVYWTSPENHRWVEASKRLLLAFARCGGRRAVVAGTCAEYDWTAAGVCRESDTPTRPRTTYGHCKLELARWAAAFGAARGVRVAWARLFWLYGPREHPARLVPSVAKPLLTGVPAPCSAGTQKRDFLHVEDAAEALVALARSELTGPVNVGSGEAVAVRDLVARVAEACGRPELVRLGERPTPANEPPLLVADTTRLRNELGWRPRIDLARGLRAAVEWWHAAGSEGVRKCG